MRIRLPRPSKRAIAATVALLALGAVVGVGAAYQAVHDDYEAIGSDCPVGKQSADRIVPGVTSTPSATELPSFALAEIADGFEQPTSVATAPDGDHLWLTEKAGRIVEVDRDGTHPRTALDLRDRVKGSGGEQGLMSFAALQEDVVVVFFTGTDDDVHVQRIELDDDEITDTRELLHVDKPGHTHNGGTVALGPDGLLYAGFGDGGGKNDSDDDAQNCANFLGKIVSIDPERAHDARSPGDDGVRILAWGLRNPYRFSIDEDGGAIYVGDVGQRRIEEVDAIPLDELHGINFGWDPFKGNSRFERSQLALGALVFPVTTMRHPKACSVTGGVVYRGSDLPDLVGTYVYADFCQNVVRGLRLEDGAVSVHGEGTGAGTVTGFGTGPDSELYAVSLNGTLLRLAPAAA